MENKPEILIEYDSCYRGQIEIHRLATTGEIVYMKIIR
jgi:hypothetical protein